MIIAKVFKGIFYGRCRILSILLSPFIFIYPLTLPLYAQANNDYQGDANKGKILYAACIQCHGTNGAGNPSRKAPRIAGQFDWYIESQIKAIKNQERKTENAMTMWPFVEKLSDQEIKDLAAFTSALPWAPQS